MALLDFGRSRVTPPPRVPISANRTAAITWQRTALKVAGTFLVLMGIAVGVLTLRFALVLMHGVVQ
jgi:hypothetical protein